MPYKDLEKRKEYYRNYYWKNNDYILEQRKKYWEKNKEVLLIKTRDSSKRWRLINKFLWITIILKKFDGLKCNTCGYNKCFDAFDFHHIDPSKKDKGISQLIFTHPTDDKIKELDKCIILCSNCHRELHYKFGKNLKKFPPSSSCFA